MTRVCKEGRVFIEGEGWGSVALAPGDGITRYDNKRKDNYMQV